jgi:hypothetical protein
LAFFPSREGRSQPIAKEDHPPFNFTGKGTFRLAPNFLLFFLFSHKVRKLREEREERGKKAN